MRSRGNKGSSIPSLVRRVHIYVVSEVALATTLSFASVEERATHSVSLKPMISDIVQGK